ncbi:hypothetical protein FRC07_012485, partial [Ceratobasidium sp. 392]
MVSTLRIATKFNHSPLRKFAIDNLELRQLPPMDYLPLAKEFNVPEWEARAIDHLAIRDEPVTVAEANLLDTESFVAMLHRREQQLRRPQKVSEQPAANNATQAPDKSRETTEDVIDLCDAPEDQLDKPSKSESPDSDSSLSSPPRYPRRKSTIQQTPVTKAGKAATQSSSDHVVQVKRAALPDDSINDKEFHFSDGNFKVLIQEFNRIKDRIENEEDNSGIKLKGEPEDFRRTFRLLYAPSYVPESTELDAVTLKSILRIATKYEHGPLREFTIRKLEALTLSPVDYISISRDFNIPGWEDKALDVLIQRDESLTSAEGKVLGVDTVTFVTAQRESILRARNPTILPSPQEYSKLSLVQQAELKRQFYNMVGLADSSSEVASTRSDAGPSSPIRPR